MFHSARIKLTAWYLTIIMLVSIAFSIVIYHMTMREVDRFARSQRFRIERQLQEGTLLPPGVHLEKTILPPLSDPDLVADTKHRLLIFLFIINSGIVIFAGGLGYFLAGKTLRPIAEMIEEQNQFITDASHELRTPLTSIKSSIEVNLRDKNLTIQEAKKLLLENMKDIDKLERLSGGLLTLAQYQKPNGWGTMKNVSLQQCIKNALQSVAAQRVKKSIRIKNISSDGTLWGNSNELTDLFIILLDNAIKYSKEKSTITVSSEINNNWIALSVADTGMGIGKKDLPHIFDRFYRADSARVKTNSGGYGLGLSIAKKIIDRHHGSITCKSTVGKGSVFTANFPMI